MRDSIYKIESAFKSTMQTTIHMLDKVRRKATQQLDQSRRSELGQFMTPSTIAAFMASRFHINNKVRLLDAGAGVGSLTAAFLDRLLAAGIPADVHAWEIDPILRGYLSEIIETYKMRADKKNGFNFQAVIHPNDFIHDTVLNIWGNRGLRFTHAILNPPYKKINSSSKHRLLLRKVGIETVNMYSAFVALSILLMEDGGEVVAIIPRSFCNGTYFRPFRDLLLSKCAIRQIHLFESRSKAFKDDDVLQENIILYAVKNGVQGDVIISTSHDSHFADYQETSTSFENIIKPDDTERYIHIPTEKENNKMPSLFVYTLREIGLEVCTGPIVDFRVKDYWKDQPSKGTSPLLYAHHFVEGQLTYPKINKKPNALRRHPDVDKWLMPRGHYVLVKRFTSKEERHRVVAYTIRPDELKTPLWGFENHLNVFHTGKKGIDRETAEGLATFLNSSMIDTYFRIFSGHTQVNATDLRVMKYPSREQLKELGRLAMEHVHDQVTIDQLIESLETKWTKKTDESKKRLAS